MKIEISEKDLNTILDLITDVKRYTSEWDDLWERLAKQKESD